VTTAPAPARLGSGYRKLDNPALVTGSARFTGDLVLPGMLHGRIVRSPFAHARIASVDPSAALALDGVVDVILPTDVAAMPPFSIAFIKDQRVLCVEKARFVGDPVAAVIAQSEEIAEEALDLIAVEYDELPLVLDPEAALRDDAPLIHEELDEVDGNVVWRQACRGGDVAAAFAGADVVLSERFRTSKQHAMPMETHGALASWDGGARKLTMWVSTQTAHTLRDDLADTVGLPRNRVRVIKPYVGGAFGHKEGLHTHEALAAIGSMRTNRPVRFLLTRQEEFSATVSRNPQIRDVEVALKRDGTILGWRERIIQDAGAYATVSPSVLALSEFVTIGPYRTPAIEIEGRLVYTNKPPSSAFRGFGNPQATFARELMLDIAARELQLEPAELRRRNLIEPGDLPHTTVNGLEFRTLPIVECTDRARAAIDYDRLRAAKRPFRGVGLVNMIEWGGGCRWHSSFDVDVASVTLTMAPDGSVTVATDAADSGQGHVTLFTQIASEILGVEPGNVDVILADTDATPWGLGTFGSRTAVAHGSALHRACMTLRERLFTVAAHRLEADPRDLVVGDGRIEVIGTDRGIDIAAVAATIHYNRSELPDGMEPAALVVTESFDEPNQVPDADGRGNFSANYSCSTSIAVVDVDPLTGLVKVIDYACAEDVGRALNPEIVTTQVQGGIAQGIGFALGEEMLFDEGGTMLNASMVDYQVPTSTTIPMIEDKLIHVESRDPTHPLQHKGVGESGITPPAAAIACAVLDAIGVPITTLPITPEKVLDALSRHGEAVR
jgi:aerobic carbon-monoxide dehydrogenase large subunit